MYISYTYASRNSKTGPMFVTTQSEDTCPNACSLRGQGCYAKYGPLMLHWRKVSSGERDKGWDAFLSALRTLQKGSLWRMSQAGDLPGDADQLDTEKLTQIMEANKGLRGFTYTHYPVDEHNGPAIRAANEAGFTINLSADTLEEADRKAATGVGPVVVIMPSDPAEWPKETPAGRRVVPCLHTTKGLQCTQCGLCAVAGRKTIVGFAAHGSGKKKVQRVYEVGAN
jgi:hypothetical protein